MQSRKSAFNLPDHLHYLNCAYKAPLLKSAEQAVQDALVTMRNPSTLGPDDFFNEASEVKQLFGEIVGSPAEHVAVIPSTSYAYSSVLNNVKCKPGANAVTMDNEFPSGYFSLKRWCDDHSAEMRVVAPDYTLPKIGADWNQKIINAIDENTGVVLISAIHWMNGICFDLERIGKRCHEVGAVFVIDGTQAVGAIPIDVNACHIDAYVCASYKWLFGPYSLGLAYIGPRFNDGRPLEESWMNRINHREFSNLTTYEESYDPGAGRYSVGEVSNMLTMPMLLEGLKFLHEITVPGVQAYAKQLVTPLLEYLNTLGVDMEDEPYFSFHLFGLKLPASIDQEALKTALKEANISVSVRGPSLRVSVNVFNTNEDIARLIEVIQQQVS